MLVHWSSACRGARDGAQFKFGKRGHQQTVERMDWDEAKSKPATGPMLGESLATLSVAELEARIGALEREIARVKAELDAKRKHESTASALFKR
jgi:uncharacterized small protein (DUF1192 family)